MTTARPLLTLAAAVSLGASLIAFQQPPAPAGPPAAPAGQGRGFAGFVRNPTFDKTPPELPKDLKNGGILIFSKTNGYRDEPAVQASNAALVAIAAKRGGPAFVTENAAGTKAAQLKPFKVHAWD